MEVLKSKRKCCYCVTGLRFMSRNLFACVQEVIIVCVWLIHSSLEGVFSKAQVVLIRPVVYRCQSRLVNYGFL